ncbi:TPA: sodium:proton exchanger [Candidatus Uhrbacteria bacterium]|nr:sodium:proton exchanger [Candidatus Uhrbacteria bacterium]
MEFLLQNIFLQIAFVIIIASGLALLAFRIRQPLIIAYMLAGLMIGPGVLGFVHQTETMLAFSEVGIAFLLFLVGMNLDWRRMKEIGSVAILVGLGQTFLTAGLGFAVGTLLGFTATTSLFLGIAFAFSSTIVVVKLLADKEELERLHGKLSVGILIVQDLLAMGLLLVLGALRDGGSLGELISTSLLKAGVVLIGLWFVARFLLPRLFRYAARLQELLFLTAIGWCFVVTSALFFLGFGIEIGALLAGISLAGTGFHREIELKIKPLRDFFLIIFFIVLGTNLSFDSLQTVWFPALIFSLFVLIGKPLIVMPLLRFIGYHPRAGFMTGATVAQISEFSFIVLAGGIAAGLIDPTVLPLATVVGMVTIAISSYLILYGEHIYKKIGWLFEWMAPQQQGSDGKRERAAAILLFGYQDMGAAILSSLLGVHKDVLVVDYDPHQIERLNDFPVRATYGDVSNEELLYTVQAHKAKLIVSTIPDREVNEEILGFVGRKKAKTVVIVTARSSVDADSLYKRGATFVIVPSVMGGAFFSELLKKKKTAKRSWHTEAKKFGA